jgi:hypothetical protein
LANENENVDGVMGMKIIKQQNFQTTWTKASLILNLGHEMQKHDVCTMWIQKDFVPKTWQKHNKIMTNISTQN